MTMDCTLSIIIIILKYRESIRGVKIIRIISSIQMNTTKVGVICWILVNAISIVRSVAIAIVIVCLTIYWPTAHHSIHRTTVLKVEIFQFTGVSKLGML